MRQVDDAGVLHEIRLSTPAAVALAEFIRSRRLRGTTRLVAGEPQAIRCEFLNRVELPGRRANERVNQFHPLVRFVSEDLRKRDVPFYRLVAMRMPRGEAAGTAPGVYAFSVHLWVQRGVRLQERLAFRAFRMAGDGEPLSMEASERLVTQAAMYGGDWLEAAHVLDLELVKLGANRCFARLEQDFEAFRRQAESGNEDRVGFQLESATRAFQRQLAIKRQRLETLRAKGRGEMPIRGMLAQIKKLEERFRMRKEELSEKRRLSTFDQQICMGVLTVE